MFDFTWSLGSQTLMLLGTLSLSWWEIWIVSFVWH